MGPIQRALKIASRNAWTPVYVGPNGQKRRGPVEHRDPASFVREILPGIAKELKDEFPSVGIRVEESSTGLTRYRPGGGVNLTIEARNESPARMVHITHAVTDYTRGLLWAHDLDGALEGLHVLTPDELPLKKMVLSAMLLLNGGSGLDTISAGPDGFPKGEKGGYPMMKQPNNRTHILRSDLAEFVVLNSLHEGDPLKRGLSLAEEVATISQVRSPRLTVLFDEPTISHDTILFRKEVASDIKGVLDPLLVLIGDSVATDRHYYNPVVRMLTGAVKLFTLDRAVLRMYGPSLFVRGSLQLVFGKLRPLELTQGRGNSANTRFSDPDPYRTIPRKRGETEADYHLRVARALDKRADPRGYHLRVPYETMEALNNSGIWPNVKKVLLDSAISIPYI